MSKLDEQLKKKTQVICYKHQAAEAIDHMFRIDRGLAANEVEEIIALLETTPEIPKRYSLTQLRQAIYGFNMWLEAHAADAKSHNDLNKLIDNYLVAGSPPHSAALEAKL